MEISASKRLRYNVLRGTSCRTGDDLRIGIDHKSPQVKNSKINSDLCTWLRDALQKFLKYLIREIPNCDCFTAITTKPVKDLISKKYI